MAAISQCQSEGTCPTRTMTEEMAPGPGQHGNSQGHDARVFLRGAFFSVAVCFLRRRAPCFQHVEANEQQNQPARNLKRGQRNAKHPEDELPATAKVVSTMKR